MILELVGNDFEYKMGAVIRLFYPGVKISAVTNKPAGYNGDCVSVSVETANAEEFIFCVSVNLGNFSMDKTKTLKAETPKDKEWILSRMLYEILSEVSGIEPPWGVLTGVRPVKMWRDIEKKEGTQIAKKIFKEEFFVSEPKIQLAKKTAELQKPFLGIMRPDTYSLYISIPFCPTRCLYCSFVSHAIENTHKLISDYVNLLAEEIKYTAELADDLGLKLHSVYFGGGTPTQLSAEELNILLTAVAESFDLSHLKEYTVEAGRPDTITEDKLEVISSHGVKRISINPQTLNQDVLDIIGRKHTVEEFFAAYELARKFQFEVINTDLIAGLPGEDRKSFIEGLNNIVLLAPENITVHTLTVKRSSGYIKREDAFDESEIDLYLLLNEGHEILKNHDYLPYYLYRQKGTKDNHENVGFGKKGAESYYNIAMMEDAQTVLGVGAGATTKLVLPNRKINRVYNYKYPYEYNNDFEDAKRKKEIVRRFYERNK